MKMFFLGSAVLSLLVLATSCSKESIESIDNQNNQLTFKTVLGKQTRASEFTNSSWVNGDQFPVKGYSAGDASTTAFFDKTLTYNGTSWSYPAPAVNQPGYLVNYHAWYPTTGVTFDATSNGNTAKISYTVPAPASQKDLIAAAVSSSTASVTLPFKHILSQVNFAVQGIKSVKIEITNIKVKGVKSAGVYTFNTAGNGSWGPLTTDADYDYTPLAGTDITDGSGTAISYMGNGNGGYTNNNALMLMPQSFTATDGGNFSFDFVLKSMTNVVLANSSVSANFNDFTTTTWAMGTRYIYLIDFTSYLLGGPITFDVTVADWVNDATTPLYAQTIQIASATQYSIEGAITSHNVAKSTTPTLVVFPISVSTDPTAATTLKDFTGTNFAANDEIRIEFPTTAGAAFIALDASLNTDWSSSVSGRVVTLKKL